ncbi:MAG: riboflavin biosynthesis protein RibF [Candidatus Caenarcaniphilales bacterium]|nr:riboflavin biosynthesis protein RibF [Candidatus Caenarcaniphilales bacterium]
MNEAYEIINLTSVDDFLGEEQARAIALGMMDGVHLGHQKLIESVVEFSHLNNFIPCAMTFREPPIKWISKETKVELITSLEERFELFKRYGIKQVIVFDFEEISKLKAIDYLNTILRAELNCKFIACGENHNFGMQKEGCTKLLNSWAAENNIQLQILQLLTKDNSLKISSSLVRKFLKEGSLKEAAEIMGHNFIVYERLIQGQQLGTKLGFPTLNFQYNPEKVQLPFGVYAAKMQIKGRFYNCAVNLGLAPTANSNRQEPILESHLLDLDGDFPSTGQQCLIEMVEFIRPEKKFSTLEELKSRIEKDVNLIYRSLLDYPEN